MILLVHVNNATILTDCLKKNPHKLRRFKTSKRNLREAETLCDVSRNGVSFVSVVFGSRLKLHLFKTVLSFFTSLLSHFVIERSEKKEKVINLLRENNKDPGQKTARAELSVSHLDCE